MPATVCDPRQHSSKLPPSAILLQHLSLSQQLAGDPFRYGLDRQSLSGRHRQQRDPAQHGSEPPPVQMAFRQQKPVVAGMFHQPSRGLHQSLLRQHSGARDGRQCGDAGLFSGVDLSCLRGDQYQLLGSSTHAAELAINSQSKLAFPKSH